MYDMLGCREPVNLSCREEVFSETADAGDSRTFGSRNTIGGFDYCLSVSLGQITYKKIGNFLLVRACVLSLSSRLLLFYAHGLGIGKRSTVATKVIERIEAHYEVQDVEMGKVYRWCPESVVVEC